MLIMSLPRAIVLSITTFLFGVWLSEDIQQRIPTVFVGRGGAGGIRKSRPNQHDVTSSDLNDSDWHPRDNEHWCPGISKLDYCQADALVARENMCRPCQRKFLIMLTMGRAASTTLTWMLDTLPGIRMSGENHNMMGFLDHIKVKTLDNQVFHLGPQKIHSPFGRNEIPDKAFDCVAQKMIQIVTPPKPPSPSYNQTEMGEGIQGAQQDMDADEEEEEEDDSDTIIGFKTILYHKFLKEMSQPVLMSEEEIQHKVDFILETFPCARIVINFRSDIEGTVKSYFRNFALAAGGDNSTNATSTKWTGQNEYKTYLLTLRLWKNLYHMAEKFIAYSASASSSSSNDDENNNVSDDVRAPSRVIVLNSDEWTERLDTLNLAVDWLGYHESCHFQELLELNTVDGYEDGKTSIKLNPNCTKLKSYNDSPLSPKDDDADDADTATQRRIRINTAVSQHNRRIMETWKNDIRVSEETYVVDANDMMNATIKWKDNNVNNNNANKGNNNNNP